MGVMGRRTGVGFGLPSLLAGIVLLLATASPVGAVERIADSGFEGATCSSVDCTSPVWHEALNSGSGVGFLCATTVPACYPNYTSTSPLNGQKWALWLQGDAAGGTVDGSVWQTGIAIPAAPATLSFAESPNIAGNAGILTVQIDGSTVYQESNSGGDNVSYERKSVSVDQFANRALHVLTFRVVLIGLPGAVTPYYPRWNIDDVSLDAPDGSGAPGASQRKCKKGFHLKKIKSKSGKVKKKCVRKKRRR
jgi:hypothetical protein